MDGVVDLVRRWATDWLEAADPAACEDLLADDYALAIGGLVLGGADGDGRDGYVRATVDGLLDRFPGATLTVHELVATEDRAAGLMTWSGTTPDGRVATWRVVAMFRAEDGRLAESRCEEDYLARRRQLKAGTTDPVPPATAAPWDVRPVPRDPAAEDAVRAWLATGELSGVAFDDGTGDDDGDAADPATDPRPDDVRAEVLECFSAGPCVAFHAHLHGRLRGAPADVVLHVAGLVTVEAGAVVTGHVVRDRLGLRRALTTHATETA
ncbi:ester cyclase [Patulibacter minatonensis]|uniref:ester cyclase n=1 Tax=Patulibacter minatonensis TaxID=298163 RepID=UPI00047B3A25|nr:nuclear transport factor 2 family protein [Patulibacter minatonensis]